MRTKQSSNPTNVTSSKKDLAPGKTGAILKLASGKAMLLDTAANGKLLNHFTNTSESIVVQGTGAAYATLTTPKARTQAVTLSDALKCG